VAEENNVVERGGTIMNHEAILSKLKDILLKRNGDLDGDVVTYKGVKYYVHVMDGIVKRLEEQ
jgi:hypothetical protein